MYLADYINIVIYLCYPMRIPCNALIFLKDVCQPYDLMWMNHRDVFGIFKNVFVIILFDVCWSSCYIENILEYVSGTSVACIAFDLAARVYK